mmetsp:Transcript_25590/g.39287  ORF Transcript_25590/g.39287 Transcript_25590/m.39287 type:complete len:86 (-) Transcript_25590:52-309(-)
MRTITKFARTPKSKQHPREFATGSSLQQTQSEVFCGVKNTVVLICVWLFSKQLAKAALQTLQTLLFVSKRDLAAVRLEGSRMRHK